MFSIGRIRAVLAALAFLLACVFAGFANEQVKQVPTGFDRVVLLIGFILGAGTASRWIASGSVRNPKGR
ncbi:hypothetical protein I603_0591 [Erythrobacter dokdonensis DSW-74]|uniref:XapX domain-containing protein n=2 Tax=Erythrobacter TaxID=1041 RepID=A0A1A7BMS2_9SPHN|nr:hypothetical protein I603_0591 [Erythrobacter dokdonensis DSW-74]